MATLGEKGSLLMLWVIHSRVLGIEIKPMVRVFIKVCKGVELIMEIGWMIYRMVKVLKLGKMEIHMKGILNRGRRKAMEFRNGQMERFLVGSGLPI
jgi:hypothetical protein